MPNTCSVCSVSLPASNVLQGMVEVTSIVSRNCKKRQQHAILSMMLLDGKPCVKRLGLNTKRPTRVHRFWKRR